MTPATLMVSPLETPTALPLPPRMPCANDCGYPQNDHGRTCSLCDLAELNGEPRPTRPTTPLPPPDQADAWARREATMARDRAINAALWAQMSPADRQRALALSGQTAQWVDWPTSPGHWWFRAPGFEDEIVRVTPDLAVWGIGAPKPIYPEGARDGWSFLDARLTPPAPRGDR